jgi:membrane-bound lytic murein transglycosylase F
VFMERMRTSLPEWKPMFVAAQEATGIDWRLLAAIAYQESQWDPGATSETGVRGFMQLTEDTARHLGVSDRLDPRQSVLAAARYLHDLKEKMPRRVAEPDRTWFALAAFNIGLGHLEDARVQAQRDRLDPDRWRDVRRTLPLLALPEYYEKARLGYARGGMPVAFVDRVRAYYDILLRTQDAHQPRLRMWGAYAGP